MEKLRTALIGLGKVGHTHARALRDLPESHFVAACHPDRQHAAAFAAQYGAAPYDDLEEMLERERVDALVVATPHPLHAAAAIPALTRGVHVLVEKPLAASLADCDAMISAAFRSGAKLGVISQRRLYPPVLRVKRAIEEGKIGAPVLGMVTMLGWRDEAYYQSDPWRGSWAGEGGGVLVNQAPHQLDLLHWFMGPVVELAGYWDNLNHPYIEVEDTAVAVLRFANGGLGNIVVSNSQKPGLYGKVHVHGQSGASVGVQTDGGAMFIAGVSAVLEPPINDLWTVPGEEGLLAGWQAEDRETFGKIDAASYYHFLQDQDFLRAVIQNRDPLVTGIEGRRTVALIDAIYRARREKSVVEVSPDPQFG